jgi:hypothetical protein
MEHPFLFVWSIMSDTKATSKKRRPTNRAAQLLFLESFAHNANVLLSAKSAQVNRGTIYKWLEHDENFSILYHQAELDANDVLRAEIDRRGREGWQEDIYQLGKYCGQATKYSDTLLIFLAKARMPEFRDKSQVDVNAQVSTTTQAGSLTLDMRNATSEELQQLKQLALSMKARQS